MERVEWSTGWKGVGVGVSMIFFGVIGMVGLVIVVLLATWFADTYDQNTCRRLQDQSHQGLIGFYITASEDTMCRAHNIMIEAPVK